MGAECSPGCAGGLLEPIQKWGDVGIDIRSSCSQKLTVIYRMFSVGQSEDRYSALTVSGFAHRIYNNQSEVSSGNQ